MNKSRHAITDIEFLSGPAIEPRNQIIYLYQKFSGVLRLKVRERVIKFAESIGCMTVVPTANCKTRFLGPRFLKF